MMATSSNEARTASYLRSAANMRRCMRDNCSRRSWLPHNDQRGTLMELNLEQRHRTLMTLWLALLLSIGSYFVFSLIAPGEISSDARIESNSALIVALT